MAGPWWSNRRGWLGDSRRGASRPWLGEKIGRYRLREALGQGGMGQVFLAEQEDPHRRVALKLIRTDTVSEASLVRFRADQQALAGVAWASWALAGIYRDRRDLTRGDLERAAELYQQALEIRRHRYPEGHEYLVLTESDYQQYLALVEDRAQAPESAGR